MWSRVGSASCDTVLCCRRGDAGGTGAETCAGPARQEAEDPSDGNIRVVGEEHS